MPQIIDLGKLRFYWAGEYNSGTVYEVNDIVKYGGNVYIYTYTLADSGHTPTDTAYWALMISGLKFEGEYANGTSYQVGDGVAYGGIVYIAIADTTGNLPPNATYWSQFADGIQYEGSYAGGTTYQLNDVVTYGGKAYIAIALTTGNVPTNATYWNLFVDGVRGLGNYANGTAYIPGDIVSYGGNAYLNILTSTGNIPTNTTYWSLLNSGIKFIGAYDAATAYKINEVVTYGPKLFVAIDATTGNLPTNATYWTQLVDGISAEGVYNSATAYTPGDLVAYGANIYKCILASTGNIPTNATYFSTFLSSIQSAGAWANGTTYYLGDLVTYGGANVYVALRETVGDAPDVSASDWQPFLDGIDARGNWTTAVTYYINDVVTRGGSTYRALVGHASGTFATDLAANKWVKYNGGLRWRNEWLPSTAYLIDDLVYNGVSTYIATADFTSDANDFANDTYWDLLSLGADTLPSQQNNENKFLSTNGTTAYWADTGTLESLTVNEGLEVLGDTLSRGTITVSSRAVNVTNKIKTNNVATLTTSGAHYFDVGDLVTVAITAGDADFDGSFAIVAVPTTTTLTYTKSGANVGSGATTGTATVVGNASIAGTLAVTGAVTASAALSVGTDATVGDQAFVGPNAASYATSAALTNPIAVFLDNADGYVQISVHNENAGQNASSDIIAYADNGDDTYGWVDMGITSSTFADAGFTITGPNDGYVFMSAPAAAVANVSNKALTNNVATITTDAAHGFTSSDTVVIAGVDGVFDGTYTILDTTSTTFRYPKTNANVASTADTGTATVFAGKGDLVLATDGTGSRNAIVFAAGGLSTNDEQMVIVPDVNVHIEIATNSVSATTGALTVVGGIGSNGDISINGTFRSEDPIFIGTGAEAYETSAGLTAAMMVVNNSDNTATSSFSQIAFRNADATSSTDIIIYMDNGDDSNGWMGMGIAGSTFDDATYGITDNGDGYIFHNAKGNTYPGNMVFATGAAGSENKIIFAAGGFDSGLTQMEITPGVNVHVEVATPSTSPTTGAFTVVGGVGISGDLNIQGNVAITGTIVFGGGGTTVSAANLSVTDPFVFVGAGNQADIVDLGFVTEHTVSVGAITNTVTDKALTNNIATLTTTSAHTLRVGDVVVVADVDATFNGTYSILTIPTSTTFTYAKTAANVASVASGTGTTSVTSRRVFDGIARDASDNVVKFFQNLVVKPTTTVDFTEAGITYADIKVDDIDAAAITSSGNLTVATDKLVVNAASGAVTMANTLGVTGVATLNGGINSSGTVNISGAAAFTGTLDVQEIRETITNPSIASNAATLDWSTGNIFFTNAASSGANITYNVTNVPTDINKIMTINIFQVQGSTGRIVGTFQIDGSTYTVKYPGGTAPTPTSSAGKIDVFSFTMHRLADSSWNVYGSSSLNF